MKVILFLLILLLNISQSQIKIEAIQNINGSGGATDLAVKVLQDADGNCYVTGNSWDGITSFITLSKFSTAGSLIWRQHFSSGNYGFDYAVTSAIDQMGNVIIAGYTDRFNPDLLFVKYNASGIRMWQKTYNGSGNASDYLASMDVDASGNIYAAGEITNQNKDIGIIKYDNDGNLLWERFYNGSGNVKDTPGEICIDNAGNVYVSGETYTGEFFSKAVTLKYSSSGANIWTQFYNSSFVSSARSITLDEDNNVVTSGYEAIGNRDNYLTIKYNSAGELVWSKNYQLSENGLMFQSKSEKVRTDSFGNIYVTGTTIPIITDNKFLGGILTIKYNSAGDTLWTSKIPRHDFVSGSPISMNISSPDKIYIASYVTDLYHDLFLFRLNSNGKIQWEYTDEIVGDDILKDVISDPQGNPIVCGHTGENLVVMKFSDQGNLQWSRSYDSEGYGEDSFLDIAPDVNGNYVVTGKNNNEKFLVKYDASLNLLFGKLFVDTSGTNMKNSKIICDHSGNIYTTDISNTANTLISKFSPAGDLIWSVEYTSGAIYPMTIAIDNQQNFTLLGSEYSGTTLDFKIRLIKYSPDGSLILNKVHNNSTAQNSDRAEKMLLDSENNMFVVGSNGGSTLLLKFDPDGNQIWERTYADGPYVKSLDHLTLDPLGNIIAGGFIGVGGQGYDYLILKYDSQGNFNWANTFNGVKNADDFVYGVVTDSLSNVYVTGAASNRFGTFSTTITTIKYDPSGNSLWIKNLLGPELSSLKPSGFCIDKFSNLYVLNGYKGHHKTSFQTVKYKSNGDSIWSFTYNINNIVNVGSSLLIDNSNNIILSGQTYGINTGYDVTSLKLSQPVNINPAVTGVPEIFSLSQNYPNPFNPSTQINYQLPLTSSVSLKVFNALGKEVATLVNEKQNAGSYKVEFNGEGLPSGIYFYELLVSTNSGEVGVFTETKRMILLK